MSEQRKSAGTTGKESTKQSGAGAGAPATPPPARVLENVKIAGLRIIYWPDPRLKKKSEPVTVFDEKLRDLSARMLDIMREFKGVGLAAPQVGLNIRLFVINPTGEPEDDKVYVNPVLSEPAGENEEKEEGCLSIPEINVNIIRPTILKMQARDISGEPFEQTASGFVTRIWQHENDHLDGRLIIDRMTPVAKMTNRKQLKKLEDDYAEEQAKKKKK
jgi:peptide deformylase